MARVTIRKKPNPTPIAPVWNQRWTPVNSSWIRGLRFVPTERIGNRKYTTGYIEMQVHYQNRRYRYGPGIKQESFQTWVVAASKGRYWWRYFTQRFSPAERIG